MKESLLPLVGEPVVVDTRSSWVYIGTLAAVHADSLELRDVDVHDSRDLSTSKEVYVHETRSSGVKANRQAVFVNLDYVVSVSPLADVIKF